MVSLKLYMGRADLIVKLLDDIILKNDHIVNDFKKMECIQSDPSFKDEDFGLKKKIEAFEVMQQEMAEEIAKSDKRGTIRAMIARDYAVFLERDDADRGDQELAAKRLMTLGLINIYRQHLKEQTKVVLKTVKELPTTGRDYSMFWRNWAELAGVPYQRES